MVTQQPISKTAAAAAAGVSSSTVLPPAAPQRLHDAATTNAQNYRLFRSLLGLRRHAQKVAEAFDPDIGDFGDGDVAMSDSDDEFNDSSSDADDTEGDDTHGHNSGGEDDAASTRSNDRDSNVASMARSAKLPTTRSSGHATAVTMEKSASAKPQSASAETKKKNPAASPAENPASPDTEKPAPRPVDQHTPSATEKPVTRATDKSAAAAAASAIQYKIIKVRKQDGTIVKVKRPIQPAPTAAEVTKEAVLVKEVTPTLAAKPKVQEPVTNIEPKTRERHTDMSKGTRVETEVHEKEIHVESTFATDKFGGKPVQSRLTQKFGLSKIVVWAIMIVFPILFILLGILAAVSNGSSVNSALGLGVIAAVKVGVSVWPIVFAAIAAQSLKMLASYKVERGLRLMTLEQLITSHSVASALKQPFFLRTINWTSVILLLLWSLSPLAGQAMLRVLDTVPANTPSHAVVGYLETGLFDNLAFQSDPSDPTGVAPTAGVFSAEITALYSAILLDSPAARQSAQDPWNNPRIPVFEELKGSEDANGWYNVSNTPGYNYTSLLGIPLAGVPNNGTTDFTISSYYLVLSCSFLNSTSLQAINATGASLTSSPSGTLWMSMNPPSGGPPAKLTFASQVFIAQESDPDPKYAYSVCSLDKSAVDSHITCVDGSTQCSVDRMRRTANPNTSDPRALGPNLIPNFVAVTSAVGASTPTMTEKFISDPNTTSYDYLDNQSGFDLSKLPLNVFNERLALVFNSFWMTGFAPMFQSNNLPSTTTLVTIDNTTDATYLDTSVVYATSWGWLTLLLFSSVVLLAAGVAGAIWDSRTIGPDVLGFASSIVRKSKYVKVTDLPSTASGAERARHLGNVRVMMQDAKPNADVGRIVLGTVSEKTEGLRPGRMYV